MNIKILQKHWRLKDAEASPLLWEYVFKEIVNVSDGHAHQIDPNSVSEYNGESE